MTRRAALAVYVLIAAGALLPSLGLVVVLRARPGPSSPARDILGVVFGSGALVVLLSLGAASLLRVAPRSGESAAGDAARRREERFLSQAAHELKTPIAVLRAVAEQALQRERSAAEYREALVEVADEARRAGEMVASLLDLARLDTGAVTLDEVIPSVAALCEEAVRAERARVPEARLELRNGADAAVAGNRALLLRALANLVANARKHAGRDARVVVFCGVEGPRALLGVDDDGPGIPPEDVERVLGRFERGRAPAGSGTGLGLPIVDGLARAHGGTLEISRSPLGGCRAVLRLPARR